MNPGHEALDSLRRLIRRHKVVELPAILGAVEARSRMTAFRRLKEAGCLTSFTHAGRYYTLPDVPDFDHLGLWFHEEVGFSRAGTLKETVAFHVEHTGDGWTHRELAEVFRVRVHNTLLDLVRERRVGREVFRGVHLYVSADLRRAAEQLAGKHAVARMMADAFRVLSAEETVEILAEALGAAPVVPHPSRVAESETLRSRQLTARHVEQVYERYGLVPGKKTPGSTPSRR
jgi:hypothetical protein